MIGLCNSNQSSQSIQSNHRNKIQVGYAFNSKKLRRSNSICSKEWQGGGLEAIFDERQEHININFTAFDFDTPLESQPKFDVILHKLTEEIFAWKENGVKPRKLEILEKYCRLYPQTVLFDEVKHIMNVLSRAKTIELLEDIIHTVSMRSCPFSIPSYMIVNPSSISHEHLLLSMNERDLRFPIICKPIDACGTPLSHQLVVVLRIEDVSERLFGRFFEMEWLFQQYYDHNEQLFKVYFIDNEVMIFLRDSLPNLDANLVSNQNTKSVLFDSSVRYPRLSDFITNDTNEQNDLKKNDNCVRDIIERHRNEFTEAANLIAERFQLRLFGFDAISPTNSEKIYIIDVNYFPSYKEVKDFPWRLRNMLERATNDASYK